MAETGRPDDVEVRGLDGRPDDVCPPGSIAGSLRVEGIGIANRLWERWVDIPPGRLPYTDPIEGDFQVFDRDCAQAIRERDGFLRGELEKGLWGYEWVRSHKPASVVVWNDSYALTRGACLAARDLEIPSVEVIHGLTHVYRIGHWETKAFAGWKLGTLEYKTWAEFYGIPAKVVVTGSPLAYPYIDVDVTQLRETARGELHIPQDAPTVCFLTDAAFGRSAWGDQGMSIGSFVEFAKAWAMVQRIVPGIHLVVKLHPQEYSRAIDPRGPEKYEAALKAVGVLENYAIVDDNLPLALGASDLTCGLQSTAMSIALCLGIPSVVLGYEPFFPEWLYKGRGFKVVREPRELIRVLTELVLGHGMGELIEETKEGARFFTGNVDGLAGARAARAIEAITDGREPDDGCWA